jgi:hypothetical protein
MVFRLFKLLPLLLLAAIIAGGWWAWHRVHRSDAASQAAAIASVHSSTVTVPGTPAAGVYRYTQTGSEQIGLGPLTIRRGLPATALLVIRPVSPTTRDETFDYSLDHAEAWRVVQTSAGDFATSRSLRVGTFGYAATVTGSLAPPVMIQPRRLRIGDHWQWIGTVGGTVFSRVSTVVRHETITAAGQRWSVLVLSVSDTATGALHGNDNQTVWYAPTLGVAVKIVWHRAFGGTIVNVVDDTLTLDTPTPLR